MMRTILLLCGVSVQALTELEALCTYTDSVWIYDVDVAIDETTDLVAIGAGQKQVFIELRATGDIDLKLITENGVTLLEYLDSSPTNWYPNYKTSMYNNMSILSCVDSCSTDLNAGPYRDGNSYTLAGSSAYEDEYIYIADTVTEKLILQVVGYRTGIGTVSILFDCPDSCSSCLPRSDPPTTFPTFQQTFEPTVIPTARPIAGPGEYENILTPGVAFVCPAGKYSTGYGATSCDNCPAGRYLDDDAYAAVYHDSLSDCEICNAGYYQESTGSSTCKACPAGRYLSDAATLASSHDALDDCSIASFGAYVTSIGASTYMDCPAGTYLDDAGTLAELHDSAEDCTICESGKYTSSPGAATCTECVPGRTLSDNSATVSAHNDENDCSICAAGFVAPLSGSSTCSACSAGKYNSGSNLDSTLHDDVSDCIDCPSGQYSVSSASTSCTLCPPGRYAAIEAGTSLATCSICPAGYISTTSGASSCYTCPAGRFLSDDATAAVHHDSELDCKIASAGFYVPVAGSASATACPAGRALIDPGSDEALHDSLDDCTICSAGKYQSLSGSSTCSMCPLGRYLLDDATSAALHDSSADCSYCPSGTFASSEGSGSCSSCESGTSQSSTGASSCDICGLGEYFEGTGGSACSKCPAGRFNDDDASAAILHDQLGDCHLCPENTYCTSPGGCASCSNCAKDFFAVSGSALCYNCGESGSGTDCVVCAPGKFETAEGCSLCPACSYTDVYGASECLPCPENTYTSHTGSSACSMAISGYYVTDIDLDTNGLGVAQGACYSVPCPVGTYTNAAVGFSSCTTATAGYYATDQQTDSDGVGVAFAASAVSSCPAGKYSESSEYFCTDCPIGKWSAAESTACSLCDAGKYGLGGSRTSDCDGPCLAGYIGDSGESRESCSESCPAGFYCEEGTARGDELTCGGANYFCEEGSSEPVLAGVGSYTTPEAGAEEIRSGALDCGHATFCPGDGYRYACPAGRYGADNKLTSSACSGPADPGFYTLDGATSANQYACGDGLTVPDSVYCPSASSGPIDVAVGQISTPYWSSVYTRTSAVDCITNEAGTFLEYCDGSGKRTRLADFGSTCVSTLYLPEKINLYTTAVSLKAVVANSTLSLLGYALSRDGIDFTLSIREFIDFESEGPSAIAQNGLASKHLTDGNHLTLSTVSSVDEGVTLLFWLRPDGFDGTDSTLRGLASMGLVSDSTSVLCALMLKDSFLEWSCSASSSSWTAAVEQPPLYDGSWTHIAVVVKTDGTLQLYINAHLVAQQENEILKPRDALTIQTVSLGAGPSGTTIGSAYVDDVAIFGLDLIDAEVGVTMSGMLPPTQRACLTTDERVPLAIDNLSGSISAIASVDAAECTSFYATFSAITSTRSSSATEAHTYCTLRVEITDLNDAPTFSSAEYTRTVPESATINTEVGMAFLENVTDPDPHQSSIFSIDRDCNEDSSLGHFGVVACTGQIMTLVKLDANVKNKYKICLTVTDDGSPALVDTTIVTIQVVNVNDPPVMDFENVVCEAMENEAVGTSLLNCDNLSASDLDGDDLTWYLSDPYGILSMDSETGLLTTLVELDYETTSHYYGIQVWVSDDEYTSGMTYVEVDVVNGNDAPVIDDRGTFFILKEKSPPGTFVGDISEHSSDPDSDVLTYFLNGTEPQGYGTFQVTTDGLLFLSSDSIEIDCEGMLKNDISASWSIAIKVQDSNGASSFGFFYVACEDINEPPVVKDAKFVVLENVSVGFEVGYLIATDPDVSSSDFGWTLLDTSRTFSLVSAPNGRGALFTRKVLDFERTSSYALNFTATDTAGLSGQALVTIIVVDVNEAPVLRSSHPSTYNALQLSENMPIGSLFHTNDDSTYSLFNDTFDDDVGQSYEYILLNLEDDSTPSNIYVDQTTGHIAGNATFDYEDSNANEIFFRVQATDNGIPQKASNIIVLCIQILDAAEPPIASDVKVKLSDNTKIGSTIAVLSAFDTDVDDVLKYNYSFAQSNLIGGELSFFIEDDRVLLNTSIYDVRGTISLYYHAIDSFGLISNKAEVTIDIIVGVYPPRFVPETQRFAIDERSAAGTSLGFLTVIDEDSADVLAHFVVGGSGKSLFDVNITTGEISVAAAANLDFETTPYYTLTVTVTDGIATAFTTLDIIVNDIQEAPTLPSQVIQLRIAENATVGATNQFVLGADEDAADADALIYTLLLTSEENPFRITRQASGNFGILHVIHSNQLDYESVSSYSGMLTVTDTVNQTATASIIIVVTDVNEPPKFANETFDLGDIIENTGLYEITNFKPPYDPEDDVLIYECSSPHFFIDRNRLYVRAPGLDYENKTSHAFTIRATEALKSEHYKTSASFLLGVSDARDLLITGVALMTTNGSDGLASRGGETIVFSGTNLGPYAGATDVVVDATYENGIDGARYHAYDCSVTEPGLQVACKTDEGVGRNHIWNVTIYAPNTQAWWTQPSVTTSYASPRLSSVNTDGYLNTEGGDLLEVTGSGFGPYCETFCDEGFLACGNDCIRIGMSCSFAPYEGGACAFFLEGSTVISLGQSTASVDAFVCQDIVITAAGTDLSCISGAGYGSNLYAQVSVGINRAPASYGQTSAPTVTTISYGPPRISGISSNGIDNPTSLATSGGDVVTIYGSNFGSASDSSNLVATYGGADGTKYQAANCIVTTAHTIIECITVVGVGAKLGWVVTRADLSSERTSHFVSYAPPKLLPLYGAASALSGIGRLGGSTEGGDSFFLTGTDLGPADTTAPIVKYGGAHSNQYTAIDCAVIVSHSKIRCTTIEGTGFGHALTVRVGNQTSVPYPGNLTYSAPYVAYYETTWADLDGRLGAYAAGGEELIIHGGNFGSTTALSLDAVFYGNAGSLEYVACDTRGRYGGVTGSNTTSCNCRVSIAHVSIMCRTVPATGVGHTWNVVIDGQISSAPTTNIEPPEVYDIVGKCTENASIAGGEWVAIHGRNFGQVQSKLDAVTYGPSTGTEYFASNCTIADDERLSCMMAPGIGTDLKWIVKVDGQTSQLSTKTSTSYALPLAFSIYPATGDTIGGSVILIQGENFGLEYPRSKIKVIFDGSAIPLDGFSTYSATAGQAQTHFYQCGAMECVRFVLPELSDTTQMKTVMIQVSSLDYENIILNTEKALTFTYGLPNITMVSNSDGEFFGTTDLVITGTNFGKRGEIYIDDQLQIATTYDHNRITLTYYDDTSGTVLVKVGSVLSNAVTFLSNSPRVISDVAKYAPDKSGYSTSGLDSSGKARNVTILGYYFAESMSSTRVFVGNMEAQVLSAGELVSEYIETSIRPFGAVLRSITFNVPAGVGSANAITVFAYGRSSYDGNHTSDVLYLRYLPPLISLVSPLELPTPGGLVTLFGKNFGAEASDAIVSIDGIFCLPRNEEDWTHSVIKCEMQAGEGSHLPIIVTVKDQSSALASPTSMSYLPPSITTISPTILATTGGPVRIYGANLGRAGSQHILLEPSYLSGLNIIASDTQNHSWIDVLVREGQGMNSFTVNVSDLATTHPYSYAAPSLSSLSPAKIGTIGGTEISIFGSNFGIGMNYKLEFCCGWSSSGPIRYRFASNSITDCKDDNDDIAVSLRVTNFSTNRISVLSPSGQSSDPLTVKLTTCADSCDESTCTVSQNLLEVNYSKPRIHFLAEETRDPMGAENVGSSYFKPIRDTNYTDSQGKVHSVKAVCNRLAGECGLTTAGGKLLTVVGENFGVEPPEIWLGQKQVEEVYQGYNDWTHALVYFVLPQGSGTDISLEVRVGEFTTATSLSYDPPVVTYVTPNQPDANGAVLRINGFNFGESIADAGNVDVFVGKQRCVPVVVGDTTASIWQESDGMPYLWCSTQRTTVGPAELFISVAFQNITYSASTSKIEFTCSDSHYGQRASTTFLTDYGGCYEPCTENSWRCLPTMQSNGAIVNCSVITEQDEFCISCPIGSKCIAHASTVYPVEPISLSGYYRIDLNDADEDVVCGAERQHRDTYCYDFVPCSPQKACTGNNTCEQGYTGLKCMKCCTASERDNDDCELDNGDQLLYYRSHGECVPCPTNYLLLACLISSAVLLLAILGYILKKKRVDAAVLAIGVDYLQVLSLFASADIKWPKALQDIYTSLSIFSLNFLNIFPPECSIAVPYKLQWLVIQFIPLLIMTAAAIVYGVYYITLGVKYKHQVRAFNTSMKRIGGLVTSNLLYGFYFIYLYICSHTLEVLNCDSIVDEDGDSKTDDEYLKAKPELICWKKGHTQYELIPYAIVFFVLYVVGYPLVIGLLTINQSSRRLILDDQILRVQGSGRWEEGLTPHLEAIALCRAKLGLLYYRFKPHVPYWIVVVTFRKMLMALITLLFHSSATFQLAMLLVVLFVCFVIQMLYMPYLSPSEFDNIMIQYEERVTLLQEEGKRSNKGRNGSLNKRRHKQKRLSMLADLRSIEGRKEVTEAVIQFVFEYNTVEATLLSASIILCILGIMLDSEYVDNGRHAYARASLVSASLVVIISSLAYFAVVIWHEILVVIFPGLYCSCFFATKTRCDESAEESLDEGLELVAPDLLKEFQDASSTVSPTAEPSEPLLRMLTQQEQESMKALILQLQEENRILREYAPTEPISHESNDENFEHSEVFKERGSVLTTFTNPMSVHGQDLTRNLPDNGDHVSLSI